MDLITQGLAGAVVAQAGASPERTRLAAGVGFFAGLLPDVDILIRSSADPLLNLEYHRQFTHSLFFVPVGALLAALLLWTVLRRKAGFATLYGFALLGYLPGGLLDTATTYGTQLLWPFSEARISWNIISIIDPVFTGVLLVGLLFGLRRRSPLPARVSILLALLYLGMGVWQRGRVQQFTARLAAQNGHVPERMEIKPTLGNLLLWRSIYESGGVFHVNAVRAGLWSTRPYPGGSIARVEPQQLDQYPPTSVAGEDIRRFAKFSDGYLVWHPTRPDVLGDLRYALRPDSTEPLWGIVLHPGQIHRHVAFATFRDLNPATRKAFFDMLLGRPPGQDSGDGHSMD